MKGKGNLVFQSVNYTFFLIFALLCVYPFYYILAYSFSDPREAARGGLLLLPVEFTLRNYQVCMRLPGIFNAFLVSVSRLVIGTAITLFFSGMFAYVLAKEKLFMRKFIYRCSIISMYLSAGLIPWYMTMRTLGLKNTFLLYVIPSAINVYYVVLIKTYIEQIPVSLEESALIDGAGYFKVFIRIILPLCKPILAAVGVFSAVGQWNAWSDNFFLVTDSKLQTIQLTLLNLLREAENLSRTAMMGTNMEALARYEMTPMSIRMTTTMIVAFPILMVYPFLQKYFIKGIMMGAVKG